MANETILPRQNSDIAGGNSPSREWYNFFRRLEDRVSKVEAPPTGNPVANIYSFDGLEKTVQDSSTARTLTADDNLTNIEFTNAGAITVTVNKDVLPEHSITYLTQGAAGQVTVVAGVGVTIDYSDSLKTRTQESMIGLKQIQVNKFELFGDAEPVAPARSALIRSANSVGAPAFVAPTADGQVLKRSSGTLVFDELAITELSDVAVSAPASGEVLKWNGSAWANAPDATGGGGGGAVDPDTDVSHFSDFAHYPSPSATPTSGSYHEWHYISNSNGTVTSADAEASHHGILKLSTLASSSARLGLRHGGSKSHRLDDGASTTVCLFRVATYPTSGEDFFSLTGFADGDTMGASSEALGIATQFSYGANWQLYKRIGGAVTTTDTGIALPAGGTWVKVQIDVSADGKTIDIDINGATFQQTSGSVIIPTAPLAPYLYITKLAGTAARTVDYDYFSFDKTFNSAR